MKFCLLLVAVLIAGQINQSESFSKCNSQIIDKIKKIWGPKLPVGILDKIKSAGKETVVATTAGYFTEAVEYYFPKAQKPELKCATGEFKDGKYDIALVLKDGTSKVEGYPIKEENGVLVWTNAEDEQDRYHFFYEDGVCALYNCNTKGASSDNTPDGLIKVQKGYKKEAIEKAKALAKEIGLDLSVTYPDTC